MRVQSLCLVEKVEISTPQERDQVSSILSSKKVHFTPTKVQKIDQSETKVTETEFIITHWSGHRIIIPLEECPSDLYGNRTGVPQDFSQNLLVGKKIIIDGGFKKSDHESKDYKSPVYFRAIISLKEEPFASFSSGQFYHVTFSSKGHNYSEKEMKEIIFM